MKQGLADYLKTGITKWPNWFNHLLLKCNVFGKYAYGLSYVKAIDQIDNIDPEKRLLEITNFAIKNVPYYRKRYANIQINNLTDFKKHIKFINKKEVMEHWDEFIVDDIDWHKCVTGTTGGTSGKPMKLVLPKNRYIHSLAFWHKELKLFGWNYDQRAVIRNHKLPKNKEYIINPILKEFIFDAFRMDEKYAKKVWEIMKKYHIKYIHAYPSGAYQFLKYCKKQNLDTSFIKLCILTSESVTEEQFYFIKNELKINIFESYGHSEKLIMAGVYPHSEHYRIENCYGYCELIDQQDQLITQTNVFGELVGTTFINKYFPLIRYKTGDYSSYADNPDGTLTYLNKIEGHRDKSIIYRADGGITSITALNLHNDVYEHIDGLQYIQKEKGKLIICIIPNEKYTENDKIFLEKHFKNAMGAGSIIEIRYVDKLIFQQNGKFQTLISEVQS